MIVPSGGCLKERGLFRGRDDVPLNEKQKCFFKIQTRIRIKLENIKNEDCFCKNLRENVSPGYSVLCTYI